MTLGGHVLLAYLLSHPTYLRYWLAAVFSDLGYWVRNIVFLFLVYSMTHHSARAVAIMLVCEYAPNVLAPFIGVFADRWDRKRTFVAANIGRALSIVVVLALVPLHNAWIAYVGAVLGTVATMFAQGSSYAFLQQFVPLEERRITNALRQMVYSGMLLIGPPIGTLVYSGVGLANTLVFCCVLFAAAAVLLATVRGDTVAGSTQQSPAAFLTELKEGLAYAFHNNISRQLMVAAVANGLVGGIINLLEIFVITEFLHLPKSMLSVLLSVQGIAMLITAPIVGRIKLSIERILVISLIVIGLGQWLMVSWARLPVTLAGVLIEGLGISAFMIAMGTIQQTRISHQYQGRFSTVNNMLVTLVMSITMLVVGWLHAFIDVRVLLMMSSVCALSIGIILYSMRERTEEEMATETHSG